MNVRLFLKTLALGLPSTALFAAETGGEDSKIRSLIDHVGSLSDAKFDRNGKEYGSADAAEFLRRKWEANRESVKTAEDFITKIATKSSTTGKPYLIRFKDGREVRCGDYLRGRLDGKGG